MYFTTLKSAAAALVVLIAIGVAAGGFVHWLHAAETPASKPTTQPTVALPEPLELLAKYEKALVPYNRMKGIWTVNTYVWTLGEKPQLQDEVQESTVFGMGAVRGCWKRRPAARDKPRVSGRSCCKQANTGWLPRMTTM